MNSPQADRRMLPFARVNTFPYEGKGDRFAVDEVRDSNARPPLQVTPTFRRAYCPSP